MMTYNELLTVLSDCGSYFVWRKTWRFIVKGLYFLQERLEADGIHGQ